MTGYGILENLLSDVFFFVIVLASGWLWAYLTRRRLHAFFGVSASKRIVIYLSNIRVLPFGSIGTSGQKLSYQGAAVAHGEMEAASRLRSLFSFLIPSLTQASKLLSQLLLSDISAQILISPAKAEELDTQAPLISLGSPAYNQASCFIESIGKGTPRFRVGAITPAESAESSHASRPTDKVPAYHGGTISYEEGSPSLSAGPTQPAGEPSAILVDDFPPFPDTSCAFVLRTKDPRNRRSLFYVAGLSEPSTVAAAQYLATKWTDLHRKFPSQRSFLVMLRVDPVQNQECSVLFEKELSD